MKNCSALQHSRQNMKSFIAFTREQLIAITDKRSWNDHGSSYYFYTVLFCWNLSRKISLVGANHPHLVAFLILWGNCSFHNIPTSPGFKKNTRFFLDVTQHQMLLAAIFESVVTRCAAQCGAKTHPGPKTNPDDLGLEIWDHFEMWRGKVHLPTINSQKISQFSEGYVMKMNDFHWSFMNDECFNCTAWDFVRWSFEVTPKFLEWYIFKTPKNLLSFSSTSPMLPGLLLSTKGITKNLPQRSQTDLLGHTKNCQFLRHRYGRNLVHVFFQSDLPDDSRPFSALVGDHERQPLISRQVFTISKQVTRRIARCSSKGWLFHVLPLQLVLGEVTLRLAGNFL